MRSCNYRDLTWNEIINLLNKVQCCRLGVAENNRPYVMPMYFNYKCEKANLKFTLRSLKEGMKVKYMHSNNKVCLEFDRNIGNAVDSVIVFGEVRIFNDPCGEENVILEVVSSSITGRRTFIGC